MGVAVAKPSGLDAAVIIPTYNRSSLLRETLLSLAEQRYPHDAFEVVVADDGSSDDTREVVCSFADRLCVRYCFQEDEGCRVAGARNLGANLTDADVLIFLDTGTIAGPNFVRAHVGEHSRGGRAIVGYVYAYRPWDPFPGLADVLRTMRPEAAVEKFGHDDNFRDWRHDRYAAVDFDLTRLDAPWLLMMGANCSVRAADFWAVGGFDDDFRAWGTEDLEIGLRLQHHGVPFGVSGAAWAIEGPHERDTESNMRACRVNAPVFLDKHREPIGELLWCAYQNDVLWSVEPDYRAVLDWTEKVRHQSVHDELERAVKELPTAPGRVAVFGCGEELPATLSTATLVDFDMNALGKAMAGGRHTGHHAIGIRTPLPAGSVDSVILTSRMRGMVDRWGEEILAEAHRIGARVYGPPAEGDEPGQSWPA
jgi:GT2 family glycosyltransferase